MCPVCECRSFRSVTRSDGSGSDLHCLRCNARVERSAALGRSDTQPPDDVDPHAAALGIDPNQCDTEPPGPTTDRTTWRPPHSVRGEDDRGEAAAAVSGTFEAVRTQRQPLKRSG